MPALEQCAGKRLAGPSAGIADGMFGMADIAATDLSRVPLVRKIHKIPFNTSRGSRPRRPLGSFLVANDAIIGSIRLHCSFVSSILILLHNQAKMSRIYFEIRFSRFKMI